MNHAQRDTSDTHTDRTAYIVKHSVSSYIDRHTIPILKNYLEDERLSLTQIAERMDFTTLSYFSRYCKKHLGMSPSEYRGEFAAER